MFASRGRSRGQHARDKRKARLPSLEKGMFCSAQGECIRRIRLQISVKL